MVLLCHRGTRLFWPNECQVHGRKCCKQENLVLYKCEAAVAHTKSLLQKQDESLKMRQTFPRSMTFNFCLVLNGRITLFLFLMLYLNAVVL